jgi:molybdopterin/thiamine biosynthesis adenylyltransferase
LTAVVTGVRSFRGGVCLTGAAHEKLVLPLSPYKTVGEAASALGAKKGVKAGYAIVIGYAPFRSKEWAVRPWWDGWKVGLRPMGDDQPLGLGSNVLAGIAAGALAVSEAFKRALGDPRAGREASSLSIWDPVRNSNPENKEVYLPKALWALGLGNLGQAYLWTFGLLPFKEPRQVELLLQDFDYVHPSNYGTSVLTEHGDVGERKSKIMEEWALRMGFKVTRNDRPFDENTRRRDFEPAVVLSGLDNVATRKLLSKANFDYVIDAGLGNTAHNYHLYRVNVFDETFKPEDILKDDGAVENERIESNKALPAYREEVGKYPEEECGIAEIAGASVAVPFVSVFASALAITQAIRMASLEAPFRTLSGSTMEFPEIRTRFDENLKVKNLGYSEAMAW